MERFETKKRVKPAGGDFAMMALMVLLAVFIGLMLLMNRQGSERLLRVWQDGELVVEMELTKATREQFIELEGTYHSTIVVSGESAGFVASDCPNQDCVHKGMLTIVGDSAVCLPNRVIVEIVKPENEADIDAVAG